MNATITELKNLWARVLTKMKDIVNDDNIYTTFFADSTIYKIEGNRLTIAVNSNFAQSIIEKKYGTQLAMVVSEVTESNFIIDYITTDSIKEEDVLSLIHI